jgi:hypothetical protein
MGITSYRIIFLLSDVVFSRVCCLISFRILLRELISDLWLCMPRDFALRCGPARPGPSQPPRPWRRAPPHAPPSLVSFPHFNSPAQQPPLLHLSLSLSPRGALGLGDGDRRNLDPRGELPSPFFFPAPPVAPSCAPCRPCRAHPAAPPRPRPHARAPPWRLAPVRPRVRGPACSALVPRPYAPRRFAPCGPVPASRAPRRLGPARPRASRPAAPCPLPRWLARALAASCPGGHASRRPCALAALPRVPAWPRVLCSIVVARRSTFSLIPFSILV